MTRSFWLIVLGVAAVASGIALSCSSDRASSNVDDVPVTAETRDELNVRSQRNGGTGVYTDTILDVSNVTPHRFGKLWQYNVDGKVYAQPLFLDSGSGGGVNKNYVYIATDNNTLYAFEADKPPSGLATGGTSSAVKKINFGPPMDSTKGNDTQCINGPARLPAMGPKGDGYKTFCSRFRAGIWGTPVIATKSFGGTTKQIIYLVAETDSTSDDRKLHPFVHTLYAVDAADVTQILGQTPINGIVDGVTFDSTYQMQRPGLLEMNGVVYIAFGANNDTPPYNGWVFAYDSTLKSTTKVRFDGQPQPLAIYCTTCAAGGKNGAGGIWQAGGPLVGDPATNSVYFMTGNSVTQIGDATSFVRLTRNGSSFTKRTYVAAGEVPTSDLNLTDLDLGGSAPLLLPGANSKLLFGAGKEGLGYLLKADGADAGTSIPEVQRFRVSTNVYHDGCNANTCFNASPSNQFPHCNVPLAPPATPTCSPPAHAPGWAMPHYPHVHGSPVYWKETNSLYVWAERDYLRRFHLVNDAFNSSVYNMPTFDVSKVPPSPGKETMPGGLLSLSYNPNTGQAIVWAAVRHLAWSAPDQLRAEVYGSGILRAINAQTLQEIWHSEQPFTFPKFSAPAISGGRVYMPTFQNQVIVYGRTDLGGVALTGASGWTFIPTALPPGDRSGNFTAKAPTVAASFGANSAVATDRTGGDFDGDGRADIALLSGPGWGSIPVALYRGDGGTFAASNSITSANTYDAGDWNPGLVRGTDQGTTNFGVWANTANVQTRVGDFDGDGLTDVALLRGAGWTTVPVAFSRGDGTFKVTNLDPNTPDTGTFADLVQHSTGIVRAGDFSGDGKTDLALIVGGGSSIPMLLSRGDGSFWFVDVATPGVSFFLNTLGAAPTAELFVADFNGDGRSDLALSGGPWTTIPMLLSNGNGLFRLDGEFAVGDYFTATNQSVAAGFGGLSAENSGKVRLVGDFNGDGYADLALIGGNYWNSIPVALYDRTAPSPGTFTATNLDLTSTSWRLLARDPVWQKLVTDVDGDGKDDIVLTGASGTTIPVAFSNGDGTFTTKNQTVATFPGQSSTAQVQRFAGRY